MSSFKSVLGGCAAVGLGAFGIAPAFAEPPVQVFDNTLTLDEVLAAQRGWCAALLAISDAYQQGGFKAAKAKAEGVIDAAYAYQYGPVAFKPTYSNGKGTFRDTRAGALAYFVGPDPSIEEFGKDQGFATYRHWKSCEIIDDVVQLFGQTANTMGFVKIVDSKGGVAMPEKTWTFLKNRDGNVRIVLHHSSAPFVGR